MHIKKRYPDSHRSTVTTQTQNKTRQNYYAILPVYAGEAYGATIMDIPIGIKRFRPICIIINAEEIILFRSEQKKCIFFELYVFPQVYDRLSIGYNRIGHIQ